MINPIYTQKLFTKIMEYRKQTIDLTESHSTNFKGIKNIKI